MSSERRRRRQNLAGSVLATCLLATAASAQTGREIMEEQRRRHEATYEVSRSQMTIVDRRGREREREMIVYSSKGEENLGKTLLKFLAPGDIRNTGLLTWEQPEGKEDDQWLYLPATRSVQRITESGKKNYFMGTDLAYEDLRPENLATHTYEVVGEEEVDGQACWVIEALPSTDKEKRDSGYSKRVFWVRKDVYLTVKVEFYDRSGKLAKLATPSDHENVGGAMWRSNELRMERLDRGSATVWTSLERSIDEPIDDNLFTQQGLKRPPAE